MSSWYELDIKKLNVSIPVLSTRKAVNDELLVSGNSS
nr:MAG TPA: hypothetical protein [Caudoviricetes sp.]